MSATSAPFGFIPARHPTGLAAAAPYKIAPAYATQIAKYQPVKIVAAGGIEAAAGAEDLVGVLAGVEYTDAAGRRVFDTKWPTGGVPTATDVTAWVWDDPQNVYLVQADGSIPDTAIGAQADITNAANAANGLSTCTLASALVAAAAQGQFRIIAIEPAVDNVAGDAFTRVYAQVARHQYVANKVTI